jgi:hypothetical protein
MIGVGQDMHLGIPDAVLDGTYGTQWVADSDSSENVPVGVSQGHGMVVTLDYMYMPNQILVA